MRNAVIFIAILFLSFLSNTSGFFIGTSIRYHICQNSKTNSLYRNNRAIKQSTIALDQSKEGDTKGNVGYEPYLKHECPSCSYVYDEAVGFKKRFPAGN
jgi:hypothetical protein